MAPEAVGSSPALLPQFAQVLQLVDRSVSEADVETRAGSSPALSISDYATEGVD